MAIDKIKKDLEEYFKDYEGYNFEFYIDETKDCYVLQVVDKAEEDDAQDEIYEFETEGKSDDCEELIKQLVNFIYNEEVNSRNRIVRGFKSFSKRKIKSLSIHMNKSNTDKIQEINKEMVSQYKLVERLQSEISYFKMFVKGLYTIKDRIQVQE